MQPQNINREDFDFSKKVTHTIDHQIKKVDYSSYKKLAFFAIAIGVFVSAGVYFGNHIVPAVLSNHNMMENLAPSTHVVQNLNNQLASLSEKDFENTIDYYKNVMTMYDNKFDYANKILLEYNLQASFPDAGISQDSFTIMAKHINEHKETITENINKFTSLKNKIIAKESLNYEESQFVLNTISKAKQNVIYQNTEVEKQFNKNLISTPKDITKYLMHVNAYDKIKALDNDIKQSFQPKPTSTINNSTKPKI